MNRMSLPLAIFFYTFITTAVCSFTYLNITSYISSSATSANLNHLFDTQHNTPILYSIYQIQKTNDIYTTDYTTPFLYYNLEQYLFKNISTQTPLRSVVFTKTDTTTGEVLQSETLSAYNGLEYSTSTMDTQGNSFHLFKLRDMSISGTISYKYPPQQSIVDHYENSNYLGGCKIVKMNRQLQTQFVKTIIQTTYDSNIENSVECNLIQYHPVTNTVMVLGNFGAERVDLEMNSNITLQTYDNYDEFYLQSKMIRIAAALDSQTGQWKWIQPICTTLMPMGVCRIYGMIPKLSNGNSYVWGFASKGLPVANVTMQDNGFFVVEVEHQTGAIVNETIKFFYSTGLLLLQLQTQITFDDEFVFITMDGNGNATLQLTNQTVLQWNFQYTTPILFKWHRETWELQWCSVMNHTASARMQAISHTKDYLIGILAPSLNQRPFSHQLLQLNRTSGVQIQRQLVTTNSSSGVIRGLVCSSQSLCNAFVKTSSNLFWATVNGQPIVSTSSLFNKQFNIFIGIVPPNISTITVLKRTPSSLMISWNNSTDYEYVHTHIQLLSSNFQIIQDIMLNSNSTQFLNLSSDTVYQIRLQVLLISGEYTVFTPLQSVYTSIDVVSLDLEYNPLQYQYTLFLLSYQMHWSWQYNITCSTMNVQSNIQFTNQSTFDSISYFKEICTLNLMIISSRGGTLASSISFSNQFDHLSRLVEFSSEPHQIQLQFQPTFYNIPLHLTTLNYLNQSTEWNTQIYPINNSTTLISNSFVAATNITLYIIPYTYVNNSIVFLKYPNILPMVTIFVRPLPTELRILDSSFKNLTWQLQIPSKNSILLIDYIQVDLVSEDNFILSSQMVTSIAAIIDMNYSASQLEHSSRYKVWITTYYSTGYVHHEETILCTSPPVINQNITIQINRTNQVQVFLPVLGIVNQNKLPYWVRTQLVHSFSESILFINQSSIQPSAVSFDNLELIGATQIHVQIVTENTCALNISQCVISAFTFPSTVVQVSTPTNLADFVTFSWNPLPKNDCQTIDYSVQVIQTTPLNLHYQLNTSTTNVAVSNLRPLTDYILQIHSIATCNGNIITSIEPFSHPFQTLRAIAPTQPPYEVAVDAVTDHSAIISWQQIDTEHLGNAQLLNYVVIINTTTVRSSINMEEIYLSTQSTVYELNNLHPRTKYTIVIKGRNIAGFSPGSIEVEFTTKDAVENNLLSPSLWYLMLVLLLIPCFVLVVALILVFFIIAILFSKKSRIASKSKLGHNVNTLELLDLQSQFTNYLIKWEELDFQNSTILGSGAQGTVFKIMYKNAPVAVKMFLKKSFGNEQDCNEFLQEAKFLHENSMHCNIIRFIGVAESEDKFALLTEFCAGGSLANYLMKNHSLRGEDAFTNCIRLAKGISAGMSYLHSKGILHRDLKAENILLDANEEPRIIDFGFSKSLTDQLNRTLNMTQNVGSAAYIAPEIIAISNVAPTSTLNTSLHSTNTVIAEIASSAESMQQEKQQRYENSFKSDVYSFGILMWVLYFRNPYPYGKNANDLQILYRVSQQTNNRPFLDESIVPEEQKWYIELMKQCWSPNPKNRPNMDYILGTFQTQ